MSDLILYLSITCVGYLCGSKLRDRRDELQWTSKVQTAAMICLILGMGMRMGANEQVTSNLDTIGLSALTMTLFTAAGTVAAIFLMRKLTGMDRYGYLKTEAPKAEECRIDSAHIAVAEADKSSEKNEEKSGMSKMTLIILCSVTLGMLIGYFFIRSMFADNPEVFEQGIGLAIKIGLCILLIFVGMDLGIDGTVVSDIKKVGLRVFAIPAATAIGTLTGGLAAGLILGLGMQKGLAISAGFGWYTLAPGIIMEAGYVTESAISFLHNVMRELFSILLIPLVAAKVGYLEAAALPGSSGMDICLPIVEKATRSEIVVYAFISGVTVTILVPILVPLFIGG